MNKETDTYKIFRQLEERNKRANLYSFYDKDELIDEILKNEDKLERYKNIIDEVLESVCCIEHNLDKYEEIGLDHLQYAQNKIAELKEYLIELKGE